MSRLSGMYAEKTHDFASIASGDHGSTSLVVPGAKQGDFVLCSVDASTSDVMFWAYVDQDDNVRLNGYNVSSASINLGSRTFRVKVIPLDAI